MLLIICWSTSFLWDTSLPLFVFVASSSWWETLKKTCANVLKIESKTRWSAKLEAVEPVYKHFDKIIKALEEPAKQIWVYCCDLFLVQSTEEDWQRQSISSKRWCDGWLVTEKYWWPCKPFCNPWETVPKYSWPCTLFCNPWETVLHPMLSLRPNS